MAPTKVPNQYIYVDESGRPEVFSKEGRDLLATGETSNHLVIASVRCSDPSRLGDAIASVAPIVKGRPRPLHAVDDSPGRRKIVCESLVSQGVIATAIVMDKRLLRPGGPWQLDRTRFYNEMLGYHLSGVLHLGAKTLVTLSHKDFDTEADLQVVANTVASEHSAFLRRMPSWDPHEVIVKQRLHASSRGLQAADYVAYAVFQAFENRRMGLYQVLQPILGRVWDLSRLTSYTRKNPLITPP